MIPIESGRDAQGENEEKSETSVEESEASLDVIDVQPVEEDAAADVQPDVPASVQPAEEGVADLSDARPVVSQGESDAQPDVPASAQPAEEGVVAAKEAFDDAVREAEVRDADLPTGPDVPLTDPQRMLDEVAAAEAQLKAAQARYEAAKAAAASSTFPQPSGAQAATASSAFPQPPSAAQAASSYSSPARPQQPASQQPAAGPAPAAGYVPPSYAQTPHAGPGAVPPTQPTQQPTYTYQQPYAYSYAQPPYTQPYVATKDHVAAGLLAIFLGSLGIHKFYLGYNTAGFIMLAVTILGSLLTFGLAAAVVWVIAVIEGVLYLAKSQTEFEQIYVFNKREWF